MEAPRERIALVFERGMKVPFQQEESIEIRDDVVRFLFPNMPAQIQLKPAEISDQELEDAGLGPYVERTINANGSRCRDRTADFPPAAVEVAFLLPRQEESFASSAFALSSERNTLLDPSDGVQS